MTESRKRSRKSKLEVREDYCEFEVVCDETNDDVRRPLQVDRLHFLPEQRYTKVIEYHTEVPAILDHDYCRPILYQKPSPVKLPRISDHSTIIGINRTSSDNKGVKIEVEQYEIPKIDLKSSVLGKMDVNINMYKGKEDGKIRMCKYIPDMLFKASKQISETSNNIADTILDIEMRNVWGNVLYTPHEETPQDKQLQAAILVWQSWYNASRVVREAPLFYQCHICQMAWWRLQPFRDHIRNHDSEMLIISLKEHLHESFIVASYDIVNKLVYMKVDDGDCYRCGENVDFHRINCLSYNCSRCSKALYTCSGLREHESMCLYVNLVIYNISIDRQCTICKHVLDSVSLKDKHMIDSHSVRSDIPVQNVFKTCNLCSKKYFTYSLHNCSKSCRNSSCEHCCRKFASSKQALSHVLSTYNRPVPCRICNEDLKAKCQEMEHLVDYHSSNYMMVFKCTICLEQNLLFLDEKSINLHRQLWHQKKADRRRMFYEKMLVPKSCLDDDNIQEAVLTGTGLKKTSQKVKENNSFNADIPTKPNNVSTADVDVTVDAIEIKKEPIETDENEEVDYEEMLSQMFNESPEKVSKDKAPKNKKAESAKENTEKAAKGDQSTYEPKVMEQTNAIEFDYSSVEVKAEPIDDIDIVENPVEEFQIKSEPVDPSDYEMDTMEDTIDYDEAIKVKIERNEDDDDNNLIIKEEFDETITVKSETTTSEPPYHDLITELEMFRDDKKKKMFNYEYSIEVLDAKGNLKQKRMYTCSKCGYTAHHKKYKVHMKTKCSVSPGITTSYPCSKCGLTFVMFNNYVLHFEKHGYCIMCCFICGEQFDVIYKFLSHVHKHIKSTFVGVHMLDKSGEEIKRSQKRSTCLTCQETVDQESMFGHWEKHLKLKEIRNDGGVTSLLVKEKEEAPELTVDCERVTMNNKELDPVMLKLVTDHLQIDSNEKECIVCYRTFARKHDLKRHIVEHLLMDAHMKKIKYRDFRCQICSEGFPHHEKYKFHMRGHGGMPIFMCGICNRTFSDSSNFAKHKKTHNVRCLVCDICKKKFHSKSALEKHIVEHTTRPLTKCTHCSKTFHSKTSFKKHRYSAHQKHRYRCILCDLFFTSLQIKWDHDWEVHQERKQAADCPICLKSFRKFSDVRVHARAEHAAEVAVIKGAKLKGKKNMQLFKVKDLKEEQKETLMVCE